MYILFAKHRTGLRKLYRDDDLKGIRVMVDNLLRKPMKWPVEFKAELGLFPVLLHAHKQARTHINPNAAGLSQRTMHWTLAVAKEVREGFQVVYSLNPWCLHAQMLYESSHELVRWLQNESGFESMDTPLTGALNATPCLPGKEEEIWFEMIDQLGKCDCTPEKGFKDASMADEGSVRDSQATDAISEAYEYYDAHVMDIDENEDEDEDENEDYGPDEVEIDGNDDN